MIEEFKLSGEEDLFIRLQQAGVEFNTIFDVGANVGDWAELAKFYQPLSCIHCFEPMPATFHKLKQNADISTTINSFGLSNTNGWQMLKFTATNDKLTTPCLELAREDEKILQLPMVDGDGYCKMNSIEYIDFIKIDTEGNEMNVLRGLSEMLNSNRIGMIQFEYGYANVLTKDLLIDYYRLLIPLGYQIGLLTPAGVHIKDYNLLDEDFKGPNYIAISTENLNKAQEIII